MLKQKIFLVSVLLFMISCRTAGNRTSTEVLSWESEEMKENARKQFFAVIKECVPLLSSLIPGAQKVDIATDPQRMAVVGSFVDHLISRSDVKQAGKAAELIKLYYSDSKELGPACNAQTTDYILSEFAIQTNVIDLAFGMPQQLKILPREN